MSDFIPVARFTDMLLQPGGTVPYNGRTLVYPDIRLVYWAGGNPFHHHQDLNRLMQAWRKPETIVFHEQFWTPAARMADIVLPATTSLERDDIGYGSREPYLIAMKKAREPVGEARDDYWIFAELAERLGQGEAYTEGRDTMAWLRHLYELSRAKSADAGVALPAFDEFWQAGIAEAKGETREPVHAGGLPRRSRRNIRSRRRRARSRSSPRRSPRSATTIARAMRPGWSPPNGWAPRRPSAIRCTCCRTSRPTSCTASSTTARIRAPPRSRAASRSPCIPTTPPRAASPTATWCASSTTAAPAWRRRSCRDRIRRGVVRLSTGAWFDPADSGSNQPLEKHGNPNALTLDIGASKLSQGCIAQTCLVEIERFDAPAPAVTAHRLPEFQPRG